MLNYSFVKKNETKPDNMGNMENSSSLETVLVINCILNAPLMLTSITGNALVLSAILRTPSLRSVPSTIFPCSLAITDFLVGLVACPTSLACLKTSLFNWWVYSQSHILDVYFSLWCFPRNNHSHKRRSTFSSSLSHDVSEFNDNKTCSICLSKSLVCFHTLTMRYSLEMESF